jgi:hypothetical protein
VVATADNCFRPKVLPRIASLLRSATISLW